MNKKQKYKVENLLLYFFLKELGSGFNTKNRTYENVRDRRLICKFLSKKGFSKKQTARVLKQNHSLVFHLLKEVVDKEFEAYYQQKTSELEEKFNIFCQENKIICKSTPKSIQPISPPTRATMLVKSAEDKPTTFTT